MKPPNILWILLDDASDGMFGYGGAPWPTPHIDRIAREGVRATACHTSSPICTPSRYSCLTARLPARCPAPSFRSRFAAGQQHHVAFNVSIGHGDRENAAAAFSARGYRTGFAGKYHIGGADGFHAYRADDNPADPETGAKLREDYARKQEHLRSLGFDFAEALAWSNTDDRPITALREHNLEWHTAAALDFIRADATRPFFLYFAPTTQHGPHHARSLQSDPRIVEHGLLPEPPPPVQPPRESVLERVRDVPDEIRHLPAEAVWTDDAIGAPLGELESRGLLDDTIVVSDSEHGPGTGSGKFTLYAAAPCIPLLIRHPARFRPGSVASGMIANVDILPTLLDCASVRPLIWQGRWRVRPASPPRRTTLPRRALPRPRQAAQLGRSPCTPSRARR